MPTGLKAGRCIQSPCGNGNTWFPPGIPEQTGSALSTKTTMHIGGLVGGGAKPFQGFGLDQDKVLPFRCGVGAHMTVEPPAFAAVAVNDVHYRVMDFEPDCPTEASARCNGLRFSGRRIQFFLRKIGFSGTEDSPWAKQPQGSRRLQKYPGTTFVNPLCRSIVFTSAP